MGPQPGLGGRPFLAGRLEADPDFRARVELADRYHLPRSRLEGREPVEVTEHEHDEQGRVVRSVTTREPEWTEQDLAEVLALAEYRAALCPCCGLPKAQVQVHERDLPDLVVSSKTCWARKKLTKAQLAMEKDKRISDEAKRSQQWSISVKG